MHLKKGRVLYNIYTSILYTEFLITHVTCESLLLKKSSFMRWMLLSLYTNLFNKFEKQFLLQNIILHT